MDALLEQAFKQFCEPLVITDIESKVIIANDAFFAMTGYSRAELIGQSLKILQGPETNLTIIQELRECLQSGRVFDGSIINYRKDGTRYRVHLTVSAVIVNGKITHYISRQNDISDQHCRELELLEAARIDLLTKLYNRNYGQRHFEETFAEYRRMNRPFSIFICDIDHFKSVNDTYGHSHGDVVLAEVASVLKGSVRSFDTVIRWGGEEFLITLKNCQKHEAKMLAKRLLQNIRKIDNPISGKITISIGVAVAGNETPVEFLKRADMALYRAKNDGRDRYVIAGI